MEAHKEEPNYTIDCPYCDKKGAADTMAEAVEKAVQHLDDSHPEVSQNLLKKAIRTEAFKMVDSSLSGKLRRRRSR